MQTNGLLSPFIQRQRLAAARPHLSAPILDYGCGDGALASAFNPGEYLGVDIDTDVLGICRERHPEHRFLTPSGFEGDDQKFATIVSLAVIEHIEDPAGFLEIIKSRLQPGGKIVLTTPHPAFETIHELGASIGIFSQEAADDHESLLDRAALRKIADASGLTLGLYRRFLFGANQLAVLTLPR